MSLQQVLLEQAGARRLRPGRDGGHHRRRVAAGVYEFQATLSNGNAARLRDPLPGTKAVIVDRFQISAGMLHGACGAATNEKSGAWRKRGCAPMCGKHVKDIAEKYLIPGETQTPAIMFVPSESIYAELYDGFLDVIQKAQTRTGDRRVAEHSRCWRSAPIQTMMKDARMREQANLIQKEVGALLSDVKRLGDRVENLQRALQSGRDRHQGYHCLDGQDRQPRRQDWKFRTVIAGSRTCLVQAFVAPAKLGFSQIS